GTASKKVDPDGVARFEDLSISEAGTYRLLVTGGAAEPDTSSTFVVEASATATALEFDQQPSDTQAGAAISPAVTVRAVDGGTTDPSFTGDVTIALGTNAGGGILSGTTTVAAVDGVATFANLSINRTGSGYTLTASASGLSGDTSNPFDVTVGPASGTTSTITAAPTSVPANGTSQSIITVEIFDALGNPRTAGGDAVVLSTTAGTLGSVTDNGNGTYTATLTAPSAPDVTTVSGTVNGAAITDTATVTFTPVAPVATRLEFGQQPTNTQAGAAISPAVTVRAVDGAGTTDPSFTGNVTIAIGANPTGGTLSGSTMVAAVNGVATFGNLSINRAGTGYTLAASANGLTGVTSNSFSITPGPASGATSTIAAAPTSVPGDGTSQSTITVEIRDALGNLRTGGGDAVLLSTTAGMLGPVIDQGNGTYTATLTAPSAAGTATISGTVNGGAITDTASVTFTPVATRLEFGQQPTNTQAGAAISPAVTVRAVDGAGTTVTSFTGNVTIAIGTNPAGGTLTGTTTVAAVAGIATFGNLRIDRTGAGYTLAAGASGLTGATSASFAVTPGAPSGATSTITAAPTSVPANGTSTSTITVELRDALGNRLTSGGAVVQLSTTAGTLGPVSDQGNGTYIATLTAPLAAGTATISGTVNGGAITDTASVTFTAVATRLVFGQQPTNTQAGAAISPAVTVRAVDGAGATVSSFTGNVTIAIGTNPAGGTLTGTTTVTAVAGIATFSNLRIDRAGAGYTLAAGASGLTGATSAAFNVIPGPPSGATSTITAAPTSVPADGTSSSTITVELRDALGNRRTSGGSVVVLSTTAGTLGPVVDRGDGTYTAELTAPSSPATATVSGTVGGAAITDTATVTFTFVPPTTVRLVFGQQPTSTQAGVAISPVITVRAVDNTGATMTSFTGPVTIAIGVNPAGGTLSGTSTVVATAGVATFTTLSIDRAGIGYRLTASSSGLAGATSTPFDITPGPPSGATTTITAQPTSVPADGSSTSTVTVVVRDAFGNLRTAGGDPVGLLTTAGTLGPVTDLANGTYIATLTAPPAAATATITGTLGGAGITDTAIVTFTAFTPTSTRLVFGQNPVSTQAGATISPPVTVRAVDIGGATITSFTGSVTISIGTNPGGGTLSGTTTAIAVAGVATFSTLSIDKAASGYTLIATTVGLTGATSAPFAITPGPVSGATSTITAAPTSIPAGGVSTSTITVELRDALGNRRTTGGNAVVLATTAGALGPVTDRGDGTYTATLTSSATPGTATISGTVNGTVIVDTATVGFTSTTSATDLAVTASVDDSEPAIGETVVYTIRATNLGSEPATGVEVSYDLSERLEFVSSVPSKGSYSPQLGVWSVGILEPGEGATLQITVEVIR
ncbi:MAG TPA: invasin domain 3-containing protein, partial [Gemmatimonadota bacterium]|nr:invasin domain 3-containing protein [Gemmatimonadota bacterium]